MSHFTLFSVRIDQVTMTQAVERCLSFVAAGTPHLVVTPNAEIVYNATRDASLAATLNGADLVVADGIGVVMASRLLGDPVPEKVGGADLSTALLERLSQRGSGRVYLLGAKPAVVSEAARRLAERFPGITLAGYHHGYFSASDDAAIVAAVRAARADVLFAGMGSPKQERWLSQHLQALNVPVCIGVGGTIDIWAGAAERAPAWMIKANLEWLFRIVKFRRFGRSLPPLVRFMVKVLWHKAFGPK